MSNTTIRGIDVTTYLIKEPKRAIAFYRDVMEMAPTWESQNGAEFTLADGATFGLWRMHDGSWRPSGGVMFAVPDVKTAADYYRKRGAKIDEYIEETPVCFMAFCEDSEGNSFILHQRKAGSRQGEAQA